MEMDKIFNKKHFGLLGRLARGIPNAQALINSQLNAEAKTSNHRAGTGGPYEGVPYIREREGPPVFRIPDIKKPLEFYLQHMPSLTWNKDIHEPDSYKWVPIAGYHASFRSLGYARGQNILELRYVSKKLISQGVDYSDILVLLARDASGEGSRIPRSGDHDTQMTPKLCRAIYYSSGGATYNHTSKYHRDGHKYGAVVVTRHYTGNGVHRQSIGIRGTEDFEFERFKARKPKVEKSGGQRTAVPKPGPISIQVPEETFTPGSRVCSE